MLEGPTKKIAQKFNKTRYNLNLFFYFYDETYGAHLRDGAVLL
nr:MAG TPA: hypothetical protein [Caudoviricetes sp.]